MRENCGSPGRLAQALPRVARGASITCISVFGFEAMLLRCCWNGHSAPRFACIYDEAKPAQIQWRGAPRPFESVLGGSIRIAQERKSSVHLDSRSTSPSTRILVSFSFLLIYGGLRKDHQSRRWEIGGGTVYLSVRPDDLPDDE